MDVSVMECEAPSVFDTVINVIQSISILIGIWVAIYGINAWRREHVGKRRIELAEQTLAHFYEAADVIRYMRSPASYAYEHDAIERGDNESDEDFKSRQTASVIYFRYREKSELFNSLSASRYQFMVAFGKEKAEPFDDLNRIVRRITTSAHMLSMMWPQMRHHATGETRDRLIKQVRDHEKIFWGIGDEADEISKEVTDVVSLMEATCREVIEGASQKGVQWRLW